MVPLAEGIDSEEQREFLVSENCPLGQGYLFAKPMAAEDVAHWEDAAQRDADEDDADEPDPAQEDREESVRALKERIGGPAESDDDGRRGPSSNGGGRSDDDDQAPWAVARGGGEGTEMSASTGRVGTAVAERPRDDLIPPSIHEDPIVIGATDDDGDEGDGTRPVESDDAAERRRRHHGPTLGH
jgi:hypothetical protein